MFQSVQFVMVHAANIQEAISWYARLLGMPPTVREGYSVFPIGGAEICFHPADEKVSSGRAGVVTYWRVADFDKAVAHATGLGASLYRGPLAIEHGDTIGQIADPFGNLFGLVGPRSGEGSYAGGERA